MTNLIFSGKDKKNINQLQFVNLAIGVLRFFFCFLFFFFFFSVILTLLEARLRNNHYNFIRPLSLANFVELWYNMKHSDC